MAAKQQLAPKWASLFRLGENYNFYSRCQSFIQAFSDAGLRNDKPGPRNARVCSRRVAQIVTGKRRSGSRLFQPFDERLVL